MSTNNEFEYYVFQPIVSEKTPKLKYNNVKADEDSVSDHPANSTMAQLLGYNDTPFDSDKPIKLRKNERIKLDAENNVLPESPILSIDSTPVISKELYEVLSPLNVSGIQLVPLTITDYKGTQNKNYYAVHVYDEIAVMDREKSEYEEGLYGAFIIERLSLDVSSVKLEDRLIFRLEEDSYCILFHKSIIDKLSEITDIQSCFIPVNEWKPLPKEESSKQVGLRDSEYGYEYSYFIPIPTNATFIPDLMQNFWIEDNGCDYFNMKEEADENTISYFRFKDTKKVIKQAYLDTDCYGVEGTLIYSKRVYEALKPHLPVKGLQLVPAEIKIAKEGESIKDMYVANIYQEYACLGGEKIEITSCKKLELDINVLSKIPLSERLVFRAKQEKGYNKFNFYHKSITQIIHAMKPNGFVFLPVEEWSSRNKTILNYMDSY